LFPGDLEEDGWLALLEQPEFRAELVGTTVLVASDHGARTATAMCCSITSSARNYHVRQGSRARHAANDTNLPPAGRRSLAERCPGRHDAQTPTPAYDAA